MTRFSQSCRLTCTSGILLLLLCSFAHARTVVGLAPSHSGLSGSQQATTQLAQTLGSQLQEEVSVRSFDDPATLYSWLSRFREIDAAILPASSLKGLPAGTIVHLLDIHPNRKAAGISAVVVRPEMPPTERSRLKKALQTPQGTRALAQLGALGAVPPGAPAPAKADPKPVTKPPQTAKKRAPKPSSPNVAVVKPPSKTSLNQATGKAQAQPKVSQPATTPPGTDTTVFNPEELKPTKSSQPPAQTISAHANQQGIQQEDTKSAKPVPTQFATSPDKSEATSPVQTGPSAIPSNANDPETVRLYIFLLLLLVAAILVKSFIVFSRLQPNKKNRLQSEAPVFPQKAVAPIAVKPPPPMSPAPSREKSAPTPTISKKPRPEKPARQEPSLRVIERGTLAKTRVPALLKRCATEDKPVQLQVTRATGETCFSFANGTITEVAIRNDRHNRDQAGCLQLLYLLSRDEFISPADSDRVVALVNDKAEPNVVSALLNLQLLKPEILQNVLEWQAKAAVFSLILFPEGEYRISVRPDQILPATPLGQDVTALIPEAAHHRAEWTAIRRALPSLDTRLQYHADGRRKLEQVGLSVQQQLLLSQIDGVQSVGDLCRESVMIDYEIYRFLYMMLKAGVLQQAQ